MKSRTIYTICFCAVSFWTATLATSAEFFGLGRLPGAEAQRVTDVSSDGSVVVGGAAITRNGLDPWRWTVEDGIEPVSCGDGGGTCIARGVSSDGSVRVGSHNGLPARWTDATGWVELEILPEYPDCRAIDVSGDGSVAVGICGAGSFEERRVAVRWTDNGIEDLGIPPDRFAYNWTRAWQVSSDGSVILVTSRASEDFLSGQTWLWREQSGYEYLADGFSHDGMTPDGSVVVGSRPLGGDGGGFRWTKEAGEESLPIPVNVVSADGSVMFQGTSVLFDDDEIRNLQEMLTLDYGLANELQGWELEEIYSSSIDGRTIVGVGLNPDGESEPWMAVLDPYPLPGDADQDFDFDQLDLVQVQVAGKYLTGEPATWGEGDWNGKHVIFDTDPPVGDGVFNQLDIVAAQQAGLYLTGSYAATDTDTFVAVPEPSGFLLAALSLLVALAFPRHRR